MAFLFQVPCAFSGQGQDSNVFQSSYILAVSSSLEISSWTKPLGVPKWLPPRNCMLRLLSPFLFRWSLGMLQQPEMGIPPTKALCFWVWPCEVAKTSPKWWKEKWPRHSWHAHSSAGFKKNFTLPPDSYQPGSLLSHQTGFSQQWQFWLRKCGSVKPKGPVAVPVRVPPADWQCRNKSSTSESCSLSLSPSPYSSGGFLFGFRDHVLKHHALHLSQRLSSCFRTIYVKLKISHDFQILGPQRGVSHLPKQGFGY